jgi:DNA modification methylase
VTPWFAEHDVTLYQGDALTILKQLPAGSVNCVCTSPPYYGLRDYGVAGQIGLEASPAVYVESLRQVFAEVRRVLRPDGVMWLNLGDSYASGEVGRHDYADNTKIKAAAQNGRTYSSPLTGLPPKNLLGVPWRVAFALQDAGWVLRNDVIWYKPNAMPESVTNRLSTRYEHVFLFTRSRRYWFNLDPIREPHAPAGLARRKYPFKVNDAQTAGNNPVLNGEGERPANELGKNPGDVWQIPTAPYPAAHFATFPPELARRCILAGCPQNGVVLDPFAGSGTTLMVARKLLRKSVGIELNPVYCELIVDRIGQPIFDFGEATA